MLLCVTTDPIHSLDEIPAEQEEKSELVGAAFEAAGKLEGTRIAVYECTGPHLRRAVLNALADLDVRQLILNELFELRSSSRSRLIRQIERAAPYDLISLDVEDSPGKPNRILVTQAGGDGEFAMNYALNTFSAGGSPTLVIPDPKAIKQSTRAVKKVQEHLNTKLQDSLQVMPVAESIDSALEETVMAGDLVLFDAAEAGKLKHLLGHLKNLLQAKPDLEFAIGITRAAHAAGPGTIERAMERFHMRVPKLDRDERRDLYEQLEKGGRLSVDFMIMLMVSSAIAALGLIQNSTAVVIGGMLVAPLMTPMLAAGMALVQGNTQLMRMSSRAMIIGITGALVSSMLIGLLSPWDDLSAQIVARGGPNVFDLGIAFLSGIAAAYALARPGLTGTLVGVAVAVALVPPLASAGIALVKFEFQIAFGAAVLFITNFLAIVLGAALVFRFFGMDISLKGNQAPAWVRVTTILLIVALVPTTAVLWENLQLQKHEGIHRPYARPLPPPVREAILVRVRQERGADIVFMAESDIEHGFGVDVVIAVQPDTHPRIRQDIETTIHQFMGEHVPRRVTLVQAANLNETGKK